MSGRRCATWIATLIVGCSSCCGTQVATRKVNPGAASISASVSASAKPPDPDEGACTRLCTADSACGAKEANCVARCESERARTKPGFVAAYAACALPAGSTCPKHDGCSEKAARSFARDEENQRVMALAVCRRAERCQGIGAIGREACLQATLHPHEADEQAGGRLVNALRRERVVSFGACVDAAPCQMPGEYDGLVEKCYDQHVVGTP